MAKRVKYVLPYPPPISTRDSKEEAERKRRAWEKAIADQAYDPRKHDGPGPPDFGYDGPLCRIEYEPIELGSVDFIPPEMLRELEARAAAAPGRQQTAAPGLQAADLPPMTDRETEVFNFIRDSGPKTGKEIAMQFGVGQKSLDRTLKALRSRGVKNRRGTGYYLDSETERGNV